MWVKWVLLSITLSWSHAYKILVVFPIPFRSHNILGDGVVRNLLNAGHEVTHITPFPYKKPLANLRQINVRSNNELLPKNFMDIKSIMSNEMKIEDHGLIMFLMHTIIKTTIAHNAVQKLLNDPKEQFDAVISEWMFSDLPAGFAAVFDCPLIWVSTVEVHWMVLNLVDQPSSPAYTVDIMSPYSPPLNFRQRVRELWIQSKAQLIQYMYMDSSEINAYDKVISPIVLRRGRQPPSFYDVRYNASLVLANSHVSTGYAISLPHSYKSVGGFHIDENAQLLSEDLQKIMSNAKNGVIYYSLGSNLKSKGLPDEVKKNILKMFGKLKQVVIWKLEEELPDIPPNVYLMKWAPQQSILSHPNCILFITHGGLLSTTEAIHFGVPIIGIPIFSDQFNNVNRAVENGFAKRIDLSYKMADSLRTAIEEVTTNPRYAQKAKELSFIYHDRPMKPGAELVHWVEHVIHTRGAPHLRSPASRVPFYQKMFLDLLAILIVILVVVLILLKRLYAILCKRKKLGSQKKTN